MAPPPRPATPAPAATASLPPPRPATAVTAAAPAAAPAPVYSQAAGWLTAKALGRVKGPAIALMITAILGMLAQAVTLVMHFMGLSGLPAQPAGGAAVPGATAAQMQVFAMLAGTVGVVAGIVGLLTGVVILLGALKMKKLEGRRLAVTASILAMIPLVSPCCWLGLPFGIWALITLNKAEVKAAFH